MIRALLAALPLLAAVPATAATPPTPAARGGTAAKPAARGATPETARGAYRMLGTARVAASPLPGQTMEVRADAVLRPGAGPRQLRARLAAQGHACELAGRLEPDGAIAFDAGQRCQIDLDGPEARGRVEARLRAGGGKLAGRELSLDLTWEISGTLSLSTGGMRVPGLDLEVPATWTPATPVRGEARASASGTRDDSRAAGR